MDDVRRTAVARWLEKAANDLRTGEIPLAEAVTAVKFAADAMNFVRGKLEMQGFDNEA